MVLSVAHITERERGSERRLGVTRYSVSFFFFARIYSFCRGSRRLLPTSEKRNNNRLQMNETVCQVQSGEHAMRRHLWRTKQIQADPRPFCHFRGEGRFIMSTFAFNCATPPTTNTHGGVIKRSEAVGGSI